jgi:multicomponent K+:H+ antiporter subunit D
MLAVTAEAFGADEDDEDDVGKAIPAPTALLGLAFAACAIMMAGLPPLAGFIGKFAMLHALLESDVVSATSWTMVGLLIVSGFTTIIAMARAGVRRFWASPDGSVPRVRIVEFAPVVVLLLLCTALTVDAGPMARYLDAAAQALHAPSRYVDGVLTNR